LFSSSCSFSSELSPSSSASSSALSNAPIITRLLLRLFDAPIISPPEGEARSGARSRRASMLTWMWLRCARSEGHESDAEGGKGVDWPQQPWPGEWRTRCQGLGGGPITDPTRPRGEVGESGDPVPIHSHGIPQWVRAADMLGGSWGIRRNTGTRVQARVRCKSWGRRNFFSFQRHPFGMDNLFSLRGVTFTKMREGWSDRNFKTPFNQGGGASAQTLRNRCRNLLRRREPTHREPTHREPIAESRTHREPIAKTTNFVFL
jgi:hypothetical protein